MDLISVAAALSAGAVAVAGFGISWLRDNMCMVESPEDAGALAASVSAESHAKQASFMDPSGRHETRASGTFLTTSLPCARRCPTRAACTLCLPFRASWRRGGTRRRGASSWVSQVSSGFPGMRLIEPPADQVRFTPRAAGFSTRAHVVRAMFEAICFQTREVLEAMRKVRM